MAVLCHAGHSDHTGLDRGVAGDVAATVEGLRQLHVVEAFGVYARAAHRLGHGQAAELERIDLHQ